MADGGSVSGFHACHGLIQPYARLCPTAGYRFPDQSASTWIKRFFSCRPSTFRGDLPLIIVQCSNQQKFLIPPPWPPWQGELCVSDSWLGRPDDLKVFTDCFANACTSNANADLHHVFASGGKPRQRFDRFWKRTFFIRHMHIVRYVTGLGGGDVIWRSC